MQQSAAVAAVHHLGAAVPHLKVFLYVPEIEENCVS
jgi:hypothetical protein